MTPHIAPLANSKFNLNSAGVAGFFGGDEAISAMATVHLYEGRRWLGWFNSPGSYTIAKNFGRMANSRFWDGLFPGSNDSPAISFGLDGKPGPKYTAALSGTTMPTGHLAYLTMEKCRKRESEESKPKKIRGRVTKPVLVGYLAMQHVDYKTPVRLRPLLPALLGLIPISFSVIACVMCGLVHDWYSLSMILLGIISSGFACAVIGKGRLVIKSVDKPAKGSPPGHGMLEGENVVVVIKGKERDVNAITKGRYELETETKANAQSDVEMGRIPDNDNNDDDNDDDDNDDDDNNDDDDDERSYHMIGVCSLLLIFQFLAQLLLIPQGTLFGQIMFLASLAVSWGYNSYLSSLEKERIQMKMLFQKLGNPTMRCFRVGTRTTMAVFVCLLLFHKVKLSSPEKERERREKVLHSCVSNDTAVWKRWNEKVVRQLMNFKFDDESRSLPHLKMNEEDENDPNLSDSDKDLLKKLLRDAVSAFKGYLKVYESLPDDSTLDDST